VFIGRYTERRKVPKLRYIPILLKTENTASPNPLLLLLYIKRVDIYITRLQQRRTSTTAGCGLSL